MPPGVLQEVVGASWTTEDLPGKERSCGKNQAEKRAWLRSDPAVTNYGSAVQSVSRSPRNGFRSGYLTIQEPSNPPGVSSSCTQWLDSSCSPPAPVGRGQVAQAPSMTSSLEYIIRRISHSCRIVFTESSRAKSGRREGARQRVRCSSSIFHPLPLICPYSFLWPWSCPCHGSV